MSSRLMTSLQKMNRGVIGIIMLVLTGLLSLAALLMPLALRPSIFSVEAGEVSSQDIVAPRSLTYTSEVLTNRARDAAEQSISPVYLPPDPEIARQQLSALNLTIQYINSVRDDEFATVAEKADDLQAIASVGLTPDEAAQIIGLSTDQWSTIAQECSRVLEQTMRTSIREMDVSTAQQNVPSLVSFSFPEYQASIISKIVAPFVVQNSIFSEDQTALFRQQARDNVQPITTTFISGETIISRGEIITPEIYEALVQFNLIPTSNSQQDIISSSVLVAFLCVFILIYFQRRKTYIKNNLRVFASIAILFVFFLFSAKILLPNRTVIPYLFPLPAFGLAVASLFNLEVSMIFSLVLSVLTSYGISNGLDLSVYYVMTSLVGVIVLGKGKRIASFFWSGLAIGIAGSAVIVAYKLATSSMDLIGLLTLGASAMLCGLASSSLTLVFQFFFSQFLGIATALQLLDISRSDHPLLQFVLRNAPGTYQHSLMVANLAEQAAESIGADSLLTRVGALYHDVGKAANSAYFIENQIPGKPNPHDALEPKTSAESILQHVEAGIQLAKKHRLPPRIQDFIREHHGTLIARYQYAKALQAANNDTSKVNPDDFRYPGHRPRSKETALLMLADGCEARARAELPKNEEEIRALVRKVVDYCESEGQLDDTSLTLKDLTIVAESFTQTLRNTYHPRIQYPEIRKAAPVPSEAPLGGSNDLPKV